MIKYLTFEVVRKLLLLQFKEVYHHILFPKPLWINNLWTITKIAQFSFEYFSRQIMTTI